MMHSIWDSVPLLDLDTAYRANCRTWHACNRLNRYQPITVEIIIVLVTVTLMLAGIQYVIWRLRL